MRTLVAAAVLASVCSAGAASPPHGPRPAPPAANAQLETLFRQLSRASSEDEAKPIETEILTLFLQSGSPSVDLLMTRAASALGGGDTRTARKLLDAITTVAPDFAEGWHQRGKLQADAGDDEGAMISLQKAVTLNPRQFAAMTELGGILAEYGDKRDALAVLRKAQAVDKHFGDVDHEVVRLAREVEGEKI
jgi:Flp pilus assembly protein TadD